MDRYIVSSFQPGRDHPHLSDDILYRIIDTHTRKALYGCSTNQNKMIEAAEEKNTRWNRLNDILIKCSGNQNN